VLAACQRLHDGVNRNRIRMAYQCARPSNVRRHPDIPATWQTGERLPVTTGD